MPGTIRVLVADPLPIWRLGVQTLLAMHEGLRFVDEAATAGDARRLVGVFMPRVLLLALDLAGSATDALLAEIHAACARTRVLVVGAADAMGLLPGLLAAGAAGYVFRDEPEGALAAALRAVGAGRIWLSPRAPSVVGTPGQRTASLSGRQREILALLARGYSNARIAEELGLRERTVRYHVAGLRAALGLASRGEAVAWAGRETSTATDPGAQTPR